MTSTGTFTTDVLTVLRALQPGQVVTYGEVATEAGYPGAARAVGNLLRALGDSRVRASASEPAGGDRGVRASASEPAGGDRGVRASASEPAGGDLDVAWWRVVAANGRVCPYAVNEATRRLAAEGVEVRNARVVRG